MKKFEVGKRYFTRSICDSDCIFEIEILNIGKRFITYIDDDREIRKSIIKQDGETQYIRPDNYSMSPIFRASREVA